MKDLLGPPDVFCISLLNFWSIMVCPKASPHADCQLLVLLPLALRCSMSPASAPDLALAVTCCSSLAPWVSHPLVSLSVALYNQFQLEASREFLASGLMPWPYS